MSSSRKQSKRAPSRSGRRAKFLLRKHRAKAAIGALVIVGMLAAILLLSSGESDAALRQELQEEFTGAYPVSPTPTGDLVEVELVAEPTTFELVNGAETTVWTYNGEAPGQEIRVRLGDTVEVTLRNELPVPTTIHWHGLRVPNPMDGVPGVTQDAVAPGETFVYTFTPPDAGTFLFHSHMDTVEQIERGLYGSLVVEDTQSRKYSKDLVWIVDDWSIEGGSNQLDGNFRDPTATEHNGRWGDVITVNGQDDYVLKARPGERLRIRWVNASTARIYALRFSEPAATLIAVDSLYVAEPRSADATLLSPGSRVDVDMVVPAEPGRYEIIEDFSTDRIVLATIEVEDEPVETPDFDPPRSDDVPRWSEALDVSVDHEFKLSLDEGQWQINGQSFMEDGPTEILPDAFTRIRFTNNSLRLHPMHLHGQFFKVLAVNGEPVDEGHFRDSVLLFKDDVVDVGLVALDEGMWALHCHILEHAAAGMTTLVHVPARTAP